MSGIFLDLYTMQKPEFVMLRMSFIIQDNFWITFGFKIIIVYRFAWLFMYYLAPI